VEMEGARLVVSSPPLDEKDTSSKGMPLVSFDLSTSRQGSATIGDKVEFSNEDGTYTVRLDSIQRLPWQDQDTLSAQIFLANPTADSKPIPKLSGKFVLDDTIDIPFQVIQEDKVIGLKGHSEIRLSLFGAIPYTYEYANLKLVLEEKVDEKTSHTLLEFAHDGRTQPPRFISVGEEYEIKGIGKNAALAVNDVRTYEGIDGDLVAVLMNVQNLEKRFADIPNLVAYFETLDGSIYPAEIPQLKDKLAPNGVATLYVSGTLPKETKAEDLRLIVGEGVSGGTDADKPGLAGAYVNAVSFAIPEEKKYASDYFTHLQFFPYTISLSQFRADMATTDSFILSFDYILSKSLLVGSEGLDRKLILEFVDSGGSFKFTEELTLGTDLKVGEHRKEILKNDDALMSKMAHLQSYEINIYEEYKGQKKRIANRKFPWFSTSD